jgi:choline dehydrogenase-like flavoprotein
MAAETSPAPDADVLIIGSGAGGATMARALSGNGLKVLILERGDFLPREKANWDPQAVLQAHRYHSREHWHDGNGKAFQPVTGYHVGGNTKFYGAAILRRRESDFAPRTYPDGTTPAWPIRYADLRHHYAMAETWYHCHGRIHQDPCEPPRDGDYPYPPMVHEPAIQEIADALTAEGLKPFSLPLAILRDDSHPESSPCIRCDTCDGFPCLLHAKGDAEVCALRPALSDPNIRLLTGVHVRRLLTGADGRTVEHVEADTPDGPRSFSAKIIVLSAGAINSAALLLASAQAAWPKGLANSNDLVGRHYMCHRNSVCVAIDPRRSNPTVFQKTLALNDFYETSGDPGFPYALGHIQNLGKITPAILSAQREYWPEFFAAAVAQHSVDWWLTTEDLPDPDNRVTLDPNGGIRLHYTPNNVEVHARLLDTWKAILQRIGYPIVKFQTMGIEAVAHQVGTLRFGNDPASSVLDMNCRARGVNNLYVVDASFMPSIAAVNPSLTIMANALRVAEHLRANFAAGSEHA